LWQKWGVGIFSRDYGTYDVMNSGACLFLWDLGMRPALTWGLGMRPALTLDVWVWMYE